MCVCGIFGDTDKGKCQDLVHKTYLFIILIWTFVPECLEAFQIQRARKLNDNTFGVEATW